jgi:hypothetical protein
MSNARVFAFGAGYFGLVFAAGFALGFIRVVLLQPYLGASVSRLFELPFMVGVSFVAARHVMRRAGAVERVDALTIGLIAFLLLLVAEMLLGRLIFRLPLSAIFADALTPVGFISLLGQSLLILFPAIAAGRERTSE